MMNFSSACELKSDLWDVNKHMNVKKHHFG